MVAMPQRLNPWRFARVDSFPAAALSDAATREDRSKCESNRPPVFLLAQLRSARIGNEPRAAAQFLLWPRRVVLQQECLRLTAWLLRSVERERSLLFSLTCLFFLRQIWRGLLV